MDNMKDIVSSVIGKLSQRQAFDQDKVQGVWKNLLTDHEKKHTQMVGLTDGKLMVDVDSPAWLYQMKIKRTKLLRRLKEEDLGIKSIVFKIGKV